LRRWRGLTLVVTLRWQRRPVSAVPTAQLRLGGKKKGGLAAALGVRD
jgi:hypothetical protein